MIRVDLSMWCNEPDCECANEMSGLQDGVMIMAMTYKKDNALCSPTSALKKKRMLSCLGAGRGTEESLLTDRQIYRRETVTVPEALSHYMIC
jgi:hypothetical protein